MARDRELFDEAEKAQRFQSPSPCVVGAEGVMAYNPESRRDRVALATAIEATLTNADFFEEWHGDDHDPTKEKTYTREIVPGIRIVVYTSVVNDAVRKTGDDAIRVVLLYRSERLGKERGIGKETRIHRTGKVSAITGRLLDRMRNAWTAGRRPNRCSKCNAPTFKAKSGNDVCADLCWKSADAIKAHEAVYQRKKARPRSSWDGRRRQSYGRWVP